MKLWSLQNRELIAPATSGRILGSWDRTPQNWRGAYRWMSQQWHDRIGPSFDSALFWCWHSCNGTEGAQPTVGTAALLMGDYKYYLASTVVLELWVPDNLCLLSSYFEWNAAVDDFLDNNRTTIKTKSFDAMFDQPLMKHDTDDIQAVIPYIDRDWIVDIRDLPESDSDWEIAV